MDQKNGKLPSVSIRSALPLFGGETGNNNGSLKSEQMSSEQQFESKAQACKKHFNLAEQEEPFVSARLEC